MKDNCNVCLAEIGSMTQAMRAQEALSKLLIPSTVQKTESSRGRGCAYGIFFSCPQSENVKRAFEREGIKVRAWKSEK